MSEALFQSIITVWLSFTFCYRLLVLGALKIEYIEVNRGLYTNRKMAIWDQLWRLGLIAVFTLMLFYGGFWA